MLTLDIRAMITAPLPDGAAARWLAGLDITPDLPDEEPEPTPDYPVVDHTRPRAYGRVASVWKSDVIHHREHPDDVDAFDDRSLCGVPLFVATIVPEGGRLCGRCNRIKRAARTPYDADHVAYVHEAGEVTALYIPDPEHAQDPRGTWAKCQESMAWWRAAGVKVIGSVARVGRRWHWEGPGEDPFPDGDPTTKRDALPGLRRAVAHYFEHTDT